MSAGLKFSTGWAANIVFANQQLVKIDAIAKPMTIAVGLGTSETVAGDINLNPTGEITFTHRSGILNYLREDSQGNLV